MAELQKQIEKFNHEKAMQVKQILKDKISSVKGINFLPERVDLDPASLKDIGFQLKAENERLFAVFTGENDGKAMMLVAYSRGLDKRKKPEPRNNGA